MTLAKPGRLDAALGRLSANSEYDQGVLDVLSLLDIGAAIQLILLEAHNAGLGCCVMAATAGYPDDLRRVLGLPETKKIILGISLGYPDWDSPKNHWQRHKEPVEQYVSWHGFE